MEFNNDTPHNLSTYSDSDLVEYVVDKDMYIKSKNVRMRVINFLEKILGLEFDNESKLTLLSEPLAKLCLATAGGGKTTLINVQLIIEKLLRTSKITGKPILGEKILVLVYNRHNVADFKARHSEMISTIKSANIKNLVEIDNTLQVYTMHKFCNMCITEFADRVGILGYKLISDDEQLKSIMRAALKTATIKNKLNESIVDNVDLGNLLNVYTSFRESLSETIPMDNDKVVDIGLDASVLEDTFVFFDSMKSRKKVYDFTDMLRKMYNLLKNDEQARTRIQRYYEYVAADEVQDFSPLMFEILRLLVNNNTPLLAVGDEDQSIYNFRGADLYNTLNFKEKFNNSSVFTLSKNRRCKSVIVDYAKRIITKNTMRFNKSLDCTRKGGDVIAVPYTSQTEQLNNIVSRLSYGKKVVVASRDKLDLLLVTQELERKGVPHYVISGYHPYSHELYRHVTDVLLLLYRPFDPYCHLALYKVLPIKQSDLCEVLGYDRNTGCVNAESKHFLKIDFGRYLNNRVFVEALKILASLVGVIKEKPMCEYIDIIFNQLNRFFWITKKEYNKTEELDSIMESNVYNFFKTDSMFEEFYSDFLSRKEICKRNQRNLRGVAVSTFHALKGLEFDEVHLINMKDSHFPNFSRISSKNYDNLVKEHLMESETRLFYVAVTRARDTLFLHYDSTDPSMYLYDIVEDTNVCKMDVFESTDNSDDIDDFELQVGYLAQDIEVVNEFESVIELNDEFSQVGDIVKLCENSKEELDLLTSKKDSNDYSNEINQLFSKSFIDNFLDNI